MCEEITPLIFAHYERGEFGTGSPHLEENVAFRDNNFSFEDSGRHASEQGIIGLLYRNEFIYKRSS